MMKTLNFLILFSTLSFSNSDFHQKAKSFLMPIKKSFMKEMKQGLQKGPYNAIDVCHLKAPHLGEGKESDPYYYGRTSHKTRNSQNAPKEKWLVDALSRFKKSNARSPLSSEVIRVPSGKLAYVEPIYIKGACLQCHGTPGAAVQKRLSKLYPNDQATGFKIGEFRGLFWVLEK